MTSEVPGRTRRSTMTAFALFGLAVAEVLTAVIGAPLVGLSLAQSTDSFVVTNSAIGLSCGIAGVLIAWQRPRNPVGWLLLAAGCFQAATAAAEPLVSAGIAHRWPQPALRTVATIAAYSWPWSIGLCLPLALLLFPDGRLPGPGWRVVRWVAFLVGPLFALEVGADPAAFPGAGRPQPWLVIPNYADLGPLWLAAELLNNLVVLAALVGLVVRYRRGDERLRRQLLWLILAVLAVAVLFPLWGIYQLTPILALLLIVLVPAAMTIAILRHQLLDIRLVVSRTVLYGLLTAAVIGTYLGLVAAADAVLRDGVGRGSSVLATLVIAAGFNPIRVRLQRVVDRALYGDRADPVRAVTRMGERLAAGTGADPTDVLNAVREALRLPYAALRAEGTERAAVGEPPDLLESIPLCYRGERVGELTVGARSGQRRLDPADRAALELLAAPLAVAVHATALSAAVQRSRQHIVAAREEERRRLRRDLHDGLGPALTGMAFQADAIGNLLRAEPDRAAELVAALRAGATEAIDDVRRLVYALRPPALDELGLVGALRRQAEHLGAGGREPSIEVDAPELLPELPAAVEVAAYRIAVEALNNAVRHAGAVRVDLRLVVNGALEIAVSDDGPGGAGSWAAGVGLCSIGERTAELGGQWRAGPADGGGGLVWARLPLESLPSGPADG
ncbi:MAG: sensor histidine kinase [Pseudonocardiaceae bacterium]